MKVLIRFITIIPSDNLASEGIVWSSKKFCHNCPKMVFCKYRYIWIWSFCFTSTHKYVKYVIRWDSMLIFHKDKTNINHSLLILITVTGWMNRVHALHFVIDIASRRFAPHRRMFPLRDKEILAPHERQKPTRCGARNLDIPVS